MNTVEHIVENYFRIIKKCFTLSDVKVIKGNNRQFDLLAHHPLTKKYYHVEISVTHIEKWRKKLSVIEREIGEKFFGEVKNTNPNNPNTDFNRGKTYLNQIKDTYQQYGIDFNEVKRVYCAWFYTETEEELSSLKARLSAKYRVSPDSFQFLSFRDEVMLELLNNVGTPNYSDEILRTVSLISAYINQI